MENRIQMALALVDRARQIRATIGDHGDLYEDSLLRREVTVELKIAVKEIVEHLRAALDYAAREIAEVSSGGDVTRPVYFPIVQREFDAQDFPSRLGQLVPGVARSRPDLASLLASFQAFSSPDNSWLADLASLANENKHEQLSVSTREAHAGTVTMVDGRSEIRFTEVAGRSVSRVGPILLDSWPADSQGSFKAFYIRLSAIDREVLSFLDECITGVGSILQSVIVSLR